jgi:hypothetical protein
MAVGEPNEAVLVRDIAKRARKKIQNAMSEPSEFCSFSRAIGTISLQRNWALVGCAPGARPVTGVQRQLFFPSVGQLQLIVFSGEPFAQPTTLQRVQ